MSTSSIVSEHLLSTVLDKADEAVIQRSRVIRIGATAVQRSRSRRAKRSDLVHAGPGLPRPQTPVKPPSPSSAGSPASA